MQVYIVCSNDIDERYGCYIDSVWTDLMDANARRDALNEDERYSYEEPWTVEEYTANNTGDF